MKMRFVASVAGSIIAAMAVALGSTGAGAADNQATRSATRPAFPNKPSAPDPTRQADYLISPQDVLVVDVFQIPDLSRTVQVDSSGQILLPLIGQVAASGRTVAQLSNEVENKLGRKYLKDPQVTVTVKDYLSQKITVDGAVVQPGIYPIADNTTLLQAIALAHGPDQHVANLSRVAVFRNAGDKRTAAIFDLSNIRDGKAPDPQIFANDVIVVDTSGTKSFLHNVIGDIAPFFGLFRPF